MVLRIAGGFEGELSVVGGPPIYTTPDDKQTLLGHELYKELIQWTSNMQHTIILGDLNETLTAFDRHPRPAHSLPSGRDKAAAHPTPIQALNHDHSRFIDCFRTLHPNASQHPGFTHENRDTASRIDYIWTSGFAHSCLIQCDINRKLNTLSHHHLLHLTLSFPHSLPTQQAAVTRPARIPNLTSLSDENKTAFICDLEQCLTALHSDLASFPLAPDSNLLSSFASQLNTITHTSAYRKLPLTASASYQSKPMLMLQRQRRDLTRMLNIANTLSTAGENFCELPSVVSYISAMRPLT